VASPEMGSDTHGSPMRAECVILLITMEEWLDAAVQHTRGREGGWRSLLTYEVVRDKLYITATVKVRRLK